MDFGHFKNHLNNKGSLKSHHFLPKFCPFINKNVSIKFRDFKELYNTKHSIVLPKNNHVTKLIVKEIHNQIGLYSCGFTKIYLQTRE